MLRAETLATPKTISNLSTSLNVGPRYPLRLFCYKRTCVDHLPDGISSKCPDIIPQSLQCEHTHVLKVEWGSAHESKRAAFSLRTWASSSNVTFSSSTPCHETPYIFWLLEALMCGRYSFLSGFSLCKSVMVRWKTTGFLCRCLSPLLCWECLSVLRVFWRVFSLLQGQSCIVSNWNLIDFFLSNSYPSFSSLLPEC